MWGAGDTIDTLINRYKHGVSESDILKMAERANLDFDEFLEKVGLPRRPTPAEKEAWARELKALEASEKDAAPSFKRLQLRANLVPYSLPTRDNRLEAVLGRASEEQLQKMAASTRPITHEKCRQLLTKFLDFKRANGSAKEKDLYEGKDGQWFVTRLLTKRPLMFMSAGDQYLLQNGKDGAGQFETIGTADEKEPLLLQDYLSYDEMQVAALLGVSVPTLFINKGDRGNQGKKAEDGSYQEDGVYVGQVGCRFEREKLMEWQQMVITKDQNTAANGYGPRNARERDSLLDIFAPLHGKEYFPTYEEVEAQKEDKTLWESFYGGRFFNIQVFRERCRLLAAIFLGECNARGGEQTRHVYAHAVGLGLGVWQVHDSQPKWMLEAYRQVLESSAFPNVAVVDFSWFPERDFATVFGGLSTSIKDSEGHDIKVRVSRRDPAEKLTGEDAGLLLVCQYAWDSNSYPGNEYWMSYLSASGDPAAACCSLIPWFQNPDINPEGLDGKHAAFYADPVTQVAQAPANL